MTARFSLLDGVACIAVHGADARTFLHAQLSQDMTAATRATLAGWHDPRGRVRALFRVLHLPERSVLLTPRDQLATVLPRLRMYVLRAAVVLETADDLQVAAVVNGDDWLEARGLPAEWPPNTVAEHGGLHWIRVGTGCAQAVGPRAQMTALGAALDRAPAELAELAEIRLGVPTVAHAVADRFVAQMLNLDLLDAISFNKGCYPGQEIIARVHNLGSVKRRMRRYSAPGSFVPSPGAQVQRADGMAVGEVVRAARDADRIELLAVVEHEAAAGALTIAPNLSLTLEPLPYDVPAR